MNRDISFGEDWAMESLEKRYREYAARAGERMTPQKLAILQYLDKAKSHPTANEIYRAVKEKLGETAEVTVYRFLRDLVKRGLVRILCVDPERFRFDADAAPHHHGVCTRCGRIFDLPTSAVSCQTEMMPSEFAVGECVEVIVRGICRECAEEGATPKRKKKRPTASRK